MIRKAKINDAKNIVYINTMGWKKTYKNIFPQSFLDKLDPLDLESIKKCQNKINEYIVYEISGKIVGFARYGDNRKNYSSNYGEIYALYVDSDYQDKKIGTKLINYILKELSTKYDYVLISTLKENSANIFYQKVGGELIGECNFILEDNTYIENIYKFNVEREQ